MSLAFPFSIINIAHLAAGCKGIPQFLGVDGSTLSSRPRSALSYLIREYLHLTIQYWTVRQRVKLRTGEKQARKYPAAGLNGGFWEQAIPHKWGNSQQAGKSGCMGLVARLAGCRDPSRPYALDPGRAYPQEGTFATSSEKYGFLTVKGFPHKWGISDAFPGCYSLLGYLLVTVWFSFGYPLVSRKKQ